ncbi:hypothetical protein V5735_04730 (plasmid) [Haladaptatus sp. SPP-AMP-3]|uniref:hypothetical protein n=1 Tax=Haladaptatus sp. SPP-AMP-3 TaxID=3121295 RepID=UPI003C30BAE2
MSEIATESKELVIVLQEHGGDLLRSIRGAKHVPRPLSRGDEMRVTRVTRTFE